MARTEHKPTATNRQIVELHAAIGTPQDLVAQVLGIDAKTLRKHYRKELDLGLAKANAMVGGTLYKSAIGTPKIPGNVTAQIFWMKTRGGWREKIEIDFRNLSVEEAAALVAKIDFSKLSPDQAAAILSRADLGKVSDEQLEVLLSRTAEQRGR